MNRAEQTRQAITELLSNLINVGNPNLKETEIMKKPLVTLIGAKAKGKATASANAES